MADNLQQMIHQENHFDISKQFFACTLDTVCGKSEDPLSYNLGTCWTRIVQLNML